MSERGMMKKRVWIIVAALGVLLMGWIGYEIYAYYNPEYEFKTASHSDGSDLYIEMLNFYINEKSIFGAPDEVYKKSADIVDGAYKLYSEIIAKYVSPMHVNVGILEEGGQTIVFYEGSGTDLESGQEEEIRKEIKFDYLIYK